MPTPTKNINAEKIQGNLSISGVSATTISATTYQNLPLDIFVTGGTYSNGSATFTNNTGGTFNVNGFYTGQTSYVNSLTTGVGLSADTTTGNINIINTDPDQIVTINSGSNIDVSGSYPNFTVSVTGLTDNNTYITGFTYDNSNTFLLSDNSGNTYSASINDVTGLTINGDLNVTGNTSLDNLTATTISATTYQNLPLDVFVTGGTFSAGTATFTNNTGGTFNLTGISSFDTYVTGGTYSAGTATFTNNAGNTFDVTGFTTGGGVSGDYLPLSGGTVSGSTIFLSGVTADSVTANTFTGDGSGLTNITSTNVSSKLFNYYNFI